MGRANIALMARAFDGSTNLDAYCANQHEAPRAMPTAGPSALRNVLNIRSPALAEPEPYDSDADCSTSEYTLGSNKRNTSNAGTFSRRERMTRRDAATTVSASLICNAHRLAKTPGLKRLNTRDVPNHVALRGEDA